MENDTGLKKIEKLFSKLAGSKLESLTILVGLSGAGKTSASNALSDSGFFVIDNLPAELLTGFLELGSEQQGKFLKTSLMLEVNSELARDHLLEFIKLGREYLGKKFQLIFLDAREDVILKRYNETRRPHPSFVPGVSSSLAEVIAEERELLLGLKEIADFVFDSSNINVHGLKRAIRGYLTGHLDSKPFLMSVQIVSFGFKRGVPFDCDLTLDVRFLSNPYFVEGLRQKTGLEEEVRDYVFSDERAEKLLDHYSELLAFLMPNYAFEGKAYLKIGIGCTGGKHRSVALSEALSKRIQGEDYLVSVRHRDLGLE